MLPRELQKYVLDIEQIISELEMIQEKYGRYEAFSKDFIAVRAVERNLSIIGEAINKMRKIDPNLELSGMTDIVRLRNIIIHSYDIIDSAILWRIIRKDVPILKQELKELP